MKPYKNNYVDLIGVGIGPFNLSLAALLANKEIFQSYFFDRNKNFNWHSGLLFPNAEIQISHLQDLVTLVDPTNPYTFISYLSKHKRLYRFIYSHFNMVLRQEFNLYLNWVSRSLTNLFFQENVENIQFQNSYFVVQTSKRSMQTKHLVLGTGLVPSVPETAKPHLSETLIHSANFLHAGINTTSKRVAVIGGGQSGAEIIQHILLDSNALPEELTWVTSRSQFSPLDDSPFVNELFTPNYVEYFHQLSHSKRADLLKTQTLASDGVSGHLLAAIYQRLYQLEFIEQRNKFIHFHMGHRLTKINKCNTHYELVLQDNLLNIEKIFTADIVILCTGYHWETPAYLTDLITKLSLKDGRFEINEDYSIVWDGPKQNRIYVQNAARYSHGIADPNLCLMAWRAAKIINSMADKKIYDIDGESTVLEWISPTKSDDMQWGQVANV